MKLSMKHETTFFQAKKPQKKTQLDFHVRIWSMGLRVLKKSIIIMPIKCWIIFFTMKSKKRGSIGRRRHFDAKKNRFENGFHQKWVCGKSAQKHKNLKKY